jgi:hypothetical protein
MKIKSSYLDEMGFLYGKKKERHLMICYITLFFCFLVIKYKVNAPSIEKKKLIRPWIKIIPR